MWANKIVSGYDLKQYVKTFFVERSAVLVLLKHTQVAITERTNSCIFQEIMGSKRKELRNAVGLIMSSFFYT